MHFDLDLSVVIPAYLEEENLRVLLPRLLTTLAKVTSSSEILVIDTMTPMDSTQVICSSLGVRYVARRCGNFYGDAVRTGLHEARGEWILFMDADGSHSPEFCLNLFGHRHEGDVIIASRYVPGGSTDNASSLILMSRIVNGLYSLVLGLSCKDVSNSFKLYKASLVKGLDLRCANFDIVEELLYKAKRRQPGVKMIELPFNFKERMFGHTKRKLVAFVLTYIFTLIRLRFSK